MADDSTVDSTVDRTVDRTVDGRHDDSIGRVSTSWDGRRCQKGFSRTAQLHSSASLVTEKKAMHFLPLNICPVQVYSEGFTIFNTPAKKDERTE